MTSYGAIREKEVDTNGALWRERVDILLWYFVTEEEQLWLMIADRKKQHYENVAVNRIKMKYRNVITKFLCEISSAMEIQSRFVTGQLEKVSH